MVLILYGTGCANLYCNSRTSVLGRLRDFLRLLMKRSVTQKKGASVERNRFFYLFIEFSFLK